MMSHALLFQGNVQDPNAIHSSLLPIVRPGTAHVARDVIGHLMKMLSGDEQIDFAENISAIRLSNAARTVN